MLEQVSIIKQVCIGTQRYSSAKSKAMYINCLESYPNEDENALGEYAVQHRCDYDDYKYFEKNQPSFTQPMLVTAEGKFEVFAGNKQFSVSKIVSVEPYKQTAKTEKTASLLQK